MLFHFGILFALLKRRVSERFEKANGRSGAKCLSFRVEFDISINAVSPHFVASFRICAFRFVLEFLGEGFME
jgi:hypothetical protein